nr:MAG TPA: hypothetical protein [Caudoviricetes sp.]
MKNDGRATAFRSLRTSLTATEDPVVETLDMPVFPERSVEAHHLR